MEACNNAEANARLIASAPALLEACKTVMAKWTPETGARLERLIGTVNVAKIKAAIHAAEGR